MIKRFMRLLRHRWFDESTVRRTIPTDMRERLLQRVRASEQRHSGEIRIYVEAGLPASYLLRRVAISDAIRQRALTLFGKLRIWDTEHNNGVLIYLLLAERRIEIIADRGLNDKIAATTWQAILERMRAPFKAGNFEAGLGLALQEVDGLLRLHFPLVPGADKPNELPNTPVLG